MTAANANRHPAGLVGSLASAAIASFLCFGALQLFIHPACAYDAQQPVFFATTEFLANHLAVPGGPSEYLGLFLSQAWYFGALGSAVSALVIFLILGAYGVAVRMMSWRARPLLSILPAVPLICMHCSYYHPMKADIVVLFTLLGAIGYCALRTSSPVAKRFAWMSFLLLVLWAAGSLGMVLFAAFSVALEARPWSRGAWLAITFQIAAGALLLWGIGALAIARPFQELLSFSAMASAWLIPSVLLVLVVTLAPLIALLPTVTVSPWPPTLRTILGHGAVYMLLVCASAAGIELCLDREARRHFLFDRLAQEGKWSEILRDAAQSESEPRSSQPFDSFYTTRALYHSGKLLETLVFSHPASPLNGLAFPPPEENGETILANGDLFFEMGAVGHAIRFASEAIAFYGYSPRLLQRLALCYAAEGKIEMARSMTAMLKRTLIERAWALSFARQLDDAKELAGNATIARLRRLNPRSVFISQPTTLAYEFRHIWSSGATYNRMAMEYFLASAPQLIGQYLDFMALASDCKVGDTRSCERCKSEFGQTFWYNQFTRLPDLFDLTPTAGEGGDAAL